MMSNADFQIEMTRLGALWSKQEEMALHALSRAVWDDLNQFSGDAFAPEMDRRWMKLIGRVPYGEGRIRELAKVLQIDAPSQVTAGWKVNTLAPRLREQLAAMEHEIKN